MAPSCPETPYAETDGLSIACHVFGRGGMDLVIAPGIISHLEAHGPYEAYAQMLRRVGERFRVIFFDKRGQGLSDSFEGVPTLEKRMDDVRPVMRTAGSRNAVVHSLSTRNSRCRVARGRCPPRALSRSGQGDSHHPAPPWRRLVAMAPRFGP